MAAIDFPNSPTNGQVFTSGGMSWTYVAGVGWTLNSAIVDAGSGFTFIQDTMPLPINVGDTWFDNSTGASGGTSWVAIEEGPVGSEKNWVQFAPGIGATPIVRSAAWATFNVGAMPQTQAQATFSSTGTSNSKMIVPGTNSIQVLEAGMYQISCFESITNNSGGNQPNGYLQALGYTTATNCFEIIFSMNAPYGSGSASAIVDMQAGHQIYVTHYTSHGATLRSGRLDVVRVG